MGVAQPYPTAGWELGDRHGWIEGGHDDAAASRPQMTASFTSAAEVLIRAGDIVSRWDATTGRNVGATLTLPADSYGDWTARPGLPQLAIARNEPPVVELWDVAAAAKLRQLDLDTPKDSEVRNLNFNSDGTLLLASAGRSPAVVTDVAAGRVVARMPQFGKYDDSEDYWESDSVFPVAFVGSRQVLLNASSDIGYQWSWPGDDIARLPLPDKRLLIAGATTDSAKRTVLYAADDGWRLLPTESNLWRASLCARLTEAHLTKADDGSRTYAIC
jgi:hypothetical protein